MTTNSPTRAKFLPVPDKPEERRDVREQRCDVDLIPIEDTRMPARFTRSIRTVDALQPVLEAIQRLGASIDRVTEQVKPITVPRPRPSPTSDSTRSASTFNAQSRPVRCKPTGTATDPGS
jgi:hypothetical protein